MHRAVALKPRIALCRGCEVAAFTSVGCNQSFHYVSSPHTDQESGHQGITKVLLSCYV